MSDEPDCRTCDYWRKRPRRVAGLADEWECRNWGAESWHRMKAAVTLGEWAGCPHHSRHADEARAQEFEANQGRLFA